MDGPAFSPLVFTYGTLWGTGRFGPVKVTECQEGLGLELAPLLATEPGLLVGIAARLDLIDEILRQAVENDLFSNKSGVKIKVSKPNLGAVAGAYIAALGEDFNLA